MRWIIGLVCTFGLGCGGRLEDAAIDSAPDGSADAPPTPSWCALNHPNAILCDDFDLSLAVGPAWSPSASPSVVGSPHVSAPHALHVRAAPKPSFLSVTLPVTYGSKIEAQLRLIADGGSTNGANPAVLSLVGEGGQKVALVALPGTNMARCEVTGFATEKPSSVDIPLSRDVWHAVSLKISFEEHGRHTITCMVDGIGQGWLKVTKAAPLGKVTYNVGVEGTTVGPVEAYYDDVVIN